ncbi:hypothetical protein PITCH_A950007 [uncultured Desulfobacterium sp.]|uniref:Uncharacterized protein n=1 Tax=uncultured Desulfobacterium sp. TaxID=201089 RepID=A0A445N441_9BACT|nr:hypothetical protein PITCH_A950007 [uncultured Desulfobacterium sp.]
MPLRTHGGFIRNFSCDESIGLPAAHTKSFPPVSLLKSRVGAIVNLWYW